MPVNRPIRRLPDRRQPGVAGSRPLFFLYVGPFDVTINQAFETDVAQPIVAPTGAGTRTIAVGQALSVELAKAVSAIKGVAPPAAAAPNVVALAHYTLEVAWSAVAQGAFVFGSSTIGGTDTFGVSTFDVSFSGQYDDLSPRFRGANVRRGRDDDRTFILQGSADFDVRDIDGLLNPENPTSPIRDLLAGHYQHVRLRGYEADGQMHPLFYGFLEKVEWSPLRRLAGAGEATLVCKDLLLWLAEARPIIPIEFPVSTGGAIALILDAIGWVDPQARSLAVGDVLASFSADGTKSALDLIGELLLAERGVFFIDGAGRAVYQDRTGRTIAEPVAAIADEMHAAVPSVDHARIRNRVRVKRTQNDYVATAINAASKTQVGDRDLEDIETGYLSSDGQADALATFVLAQLSNPVAPMRDLKIDNRTEALLAQCLARELGDVVTLSAAAADIVNPDYLIDSLQHRIDPRRLKHETTWLLSQHSHVTPFLIGSSVLVASGSSPGDELVY